MLQQLSIENYAIIDKIRIDFEEGMNIITGETGAGKSILTGALSLILGERADGSVLQHKDKKCIVEGTFKTNRSSIKKFLAENEMDAENEKDDEIVIRREIAPNGKSRAFINDTPVNLMQLKTLASLLVDLHQQFDTQELGDNNFQREVIDALANNSAELKAYEDAYKKYFAANRQLSEWQQQQASATKEFDYNKFLFDELEEAGFRENELEDLNAELKMVSNAENIKSILNNIYTALQQSDHPLIQQVKSLSNQLQTLPDFNSKIASLVERIKATQIELQDIADEVDRLNDSVNYDPQKVQNINDKLAVGYRLLKKHGVQTTAQLLAIKNDLQQKLEAVINLEQAIGDKEKATKEFYSQAEKIAVIITGKRKQEIVPFEEKVNELLRQVGMPNAKIKVQLQQLTSLQQSGQDTVSFLFNANLPAGKITKMEMFEPLNKVASGGELSRLMLNIKSLVAKSVQLPTLIFDEIDTGISGEAAKQVGIIMKKLSINHQVIAITHQPQIAAKAIAHFFVYKEIKEDRIVTSVKKLNRDERITTIATMLSGERPTAAAFANAREMIGN
ncbi:MAG: DNA repair protein RecN [Chitinophagaceae bacterium]|nr:DNA repair protein RecN [Chitinophagaceae bacterium]